MDSFQLNIPLYRIPLKLTDKVDFENVINDYISKTYKVSNEDDFTNEIAIFNRLRQDIRDAGKDIIGRNILYKYYKQLEDLEILIKIDPNIKFNWYDAFTGVGASMASVNYEKACVLFNLAAILSNIAASQDRSKEKGRKIALEYFQASADIFSKINTKFSDYQEDFPTIDIKHKSIKCLYKLMRASAQECILENYIYTKKEYNDICQMASYLSELYEQINIILHKIMESDKYKNHYYSMILRIEIKTKFYEIISNFYKALVSENEAKYNFFISYLIRSENIVKETLSLIQNYKEMNKSSFMDDIVNYYLKVINVMRTQAINDNNIIYGEKIFPDHNKLEKPKPCCKLDDFEFENIFVHGEKEIKNIIGKEIFQKLRKYKKKKKRN